MVPIRIRLVSRGACALIVVAGLLGAAATLRSEDANDKPTLSVDVKVVTLPVTVRDKKGQIVRNLTKDDFELQENGKPQSIRYFSQETDLPLTLGLLVDTSMSVRNVLDQERTASKSFLDQMMTRPKDQAFLIHFDREVELLQDLTPSRDKLESALQLLQTPQRGDNSSSSGDPDSGSHRARGGGTALYDAVFLAADEVIKKQQGRKALIVLSDGVDTVSGTSLSRAIEGAQRADTLIYSLCYADRDSDRRDQARGAGVLSTLAEQTGGRYFKVSGEQSLDEVYSLIQDELRNQYNLGYVPVSDGPAYRKIRVSVNRKGLTVQSRDGYYRGS